MERAPRDIAWAAGLFEGEGYIGLRVSGTKKCYPRMALNSTDEDVVRRFCKLIGIGYVNGPYQTQPNRKPWWVWNVSGLEKVQAVVAMLWPDLGQRRRNKAVEVLTAARR